MSAYRWAMLVAAAVVGCAPEREPAPRPPPTPAEVPEARATARPPERLVLPLPERIEAGPESRDPFQAFVPKSETPPDQRLRKSRKFTLDQLKLVGLVTGAGTPRAMVVDPTGKGWVVTPGELVGRPELVGAGGTEHLASWRVDRIRERDLVLVRDDAPGVTRVLAMASEPLLGMQDE